MKITFQLTVLAASVATLAYLAMPALADEWDKQTTLKINEPVEVPGHVLLPGTYLFRLADSQSDRDIMQVFRQDKKGMDHLVTTQFVIPAYQLNTPSSPEVKFEERHSNTPEALHLLFYPGDNYGWEFVYPKNQRLEEVAANTPPPAPVAPASKAVVTPKPAPPAAAAAPAPQPVAPPVQVAQNHPPAAPAATPAPRELPKTASNLPSAMALGTLMLLLGGGILGFALRRVHA